MLKRLHFDIKFAGETVGFPARGAAAQGPGGGQEGGDIGGMVIYHLYIDQKISS